MKHVKQKIDLSEWSLEATSEIEKIALKGASEALQYIFEDKDTNIFLPLLYSAKAYNCDGVGGKPVSDPMTIYLSIAAGPEGNNPTFSFSLSDAVDDFLYEFTQIDPDRENEHLKDLKTLAKKLSAGLKGLAKRVDDACE